MVIEHPPSRTSKTPETSSLVGHEVLLRPDMSASAPMVFGTEGDVPEWLWQSFALSGDDCQAARRSMAAMVLSRLSRRVPFEIQDGIRLARLPFACGVRTRTSAATKALMKLR